MKRMLAMLVGCLVLTGIVTTAEAKPAWYVCEIVTIGGSTLGQDENTFYVQLTERNSTFSRKWAVIDSDDSQSGNRALAVGLSAIASGAKVYVYLDNSIQYPLIKAFYLINPSPSYK
jgi:hypothetical protein